MTRRAAHLANITEGIERLQRHGIKPTIDFMYGLPHQGMPDIERSLAFLARFPMAHPQFPPTLLAPKSEEPLDLLEALIAALRRLPSHWLDRLVSPPGRRRLAARRLFIHLPHRPAFDPRGRAAAKALLASVFH